eukprot:CAMPEP_0177716866 /NCGR_PEP_ID=MMETSP0484_2-20121128/14729_1 /TAXON_ID=354590 /ORGANISM="Rhodomonas lens, Strain RHODO" /LENGTH=199 /DNA_ID=CAMNT_0019228907 /DNA_START=623 /DNA_END=1220 /DNA_ORIENTATION=+
MTHGVSDDSDHGCSQKECWDDLQHPHGGERESERGRAERLERRLAAVEHRKEVLAARLRREEARSGQLEEERARLARLVARRAAAPAPPDARSLLPPSFSRSPAQLSAHAAASSPVAYDMAYSSLLGLEPRPRASSSPQRRGARGSGRGGVRVWWEGEEEAGGDAEPSAHGTHAACPGSSWYEFGGHASHSTSPSRAWN